MSDELNHNSLVTLREEFKKDSGKKPGTLQIGFWNGQAQLTMWPEEKGSGPILKEAFKNLKAYFYFVRGLKKIPTMAPGSSTTLAATLWNQETKKSEPNSTYTFGIDDAGNAYLGISTASGKFKFPITGEFSLQLPDGLSKAEELRDHVGSLTDALDACAVAMLMSGPKKRQLNGKDGYGGNTSGGQSSGGGAPAAGASDSAW